MSYTGRIGIGTKSPLQALDVNGNVNLAANSALYFNNEKAIQVNDFNVAVGIGAMQNGFNNGGNTAIGPAAMGSLKVGFSNVAVGSGAMTDMLFGGQNTAVGGAALAEMETLNDSTALRYFANVSSGSRNATALGYHAFACQSNQVIVGDQDVSSIGGFVGWRNISDGRVKTNIKDNVPALYL